MTKSLSLFSTLIAAFLLLSTSCKKDDPDPVNDEEVITTLNYTLTPESGGDAIVFSFQDLDGDGGEDGVITVSTLAANTMYTGSIELLNEQASPTEDITEEVKEEDADHQFFFDVDAEGLSITYDDTDANGNPVGLSTRLTTTTAGSGNVTITLKHLPEKTAEGVSSGNITNAGGETDIKVTFPVDVQ